MNRSLIVQIGIIAFCAWSVVELAINFPYPAPLIRPFLPPTLLWPTQQIQGWVNTQDFPSSFLQYFARDPERTIPPGANLVAPADGVIGDVLHRDGITYLVVNMSFWDVHVIRAPAAGTVTEVDDEGAHLVRSVKNKEQMVAEIYERGKEAPVQK